MVLVLVESLPLKVLDVIQVGWIPLYASSFLLLICVSLNLAFDLCVSESFPWVAWFLNDYIFDIKHF